jgi:hypothetical protein
VGGNFREISMFGVMHSRPPDALANKRLRRFSHDSFPLAEIVARRSE